ncbi:MAG: HNH endonuclease [Alistipes sp.]|nr:HNH endonuclease [Alistipes sp.]
MHHYTEQEVQWLRDKVGTATYEELATQFSESFGYPVTASSLKSKCQKLGISGVHHPFTEEQDEWLRKQCCKYANYLEVAEAFNQRFGTDKTERGIQSHCARFLKLISGRQAFKKGSIPWNDPPIGTETVHANGYTYVKIRNTGLKNQDYIEKHRLIWQQHYGKKVPKGHVIVFLNSDKMDFSIENLYCISRKISTIMVTNGWFTDSREHTLTAIKWCELHFALKGVK